MPGYNCCIKERMLYSTCKAPLMDYVEQTLKMEITRKVMVLAKSFHELHSTMLYMLVFK